MKIPTPANRDKDVSTYPRLQVAVRLEGKAAETAVLAPGVWSFGSGAHVDVTLAHSTIRALHAVVVFDGQSVTLHCLAFPDFTRVNGRIIREQVVSAGDVVECGLFRLDFRVEAAPQTTAALPEVKLFPDLDAATDWNWDAELIDADALESESLDHPGVFGDGVLEAGNPEAEIFEGALFGAGHPEENAGLKSDLLGAELFDDVEVMEAASIAPLAGLPSSIDPLINGGYREVPQEAGAGSPRPLSAVAAPVPAGPVAAEPTWPLPPAAAPAPVRAVAVEPTRPLPLAAAPAAVPGPAARLAVEPTRPIPVAAAPSKVSGVAVKATTHPQPKKPGRTGKPGKRETAGHGLRLFVELSWGDARLYRKSFTPTTEQVLARPDDQAPVPLWGFELGRPEHLLAVPSPAGFEVFPPPGARVERLDADGNVLPGEPTSPGRSLSVTQGMSLRMTEGNMTLRVKAAPAERMPFVMPGRDLPWVAVACTVLLVGAVGVFVSRMPEVVRTAPPEPTKAQWAAVQLRMPKPEKKAEVEKKLDDKKKEKPKPETRKVARKSTPEPAPTREPIKALSKLAAADTSKLLASTSNLNALTANPKGPNLAGLLGAPDLPSPMGIGVPQGRSTSGAELLRGGRVGALGSRTIGRGGAVAGTVRRASSSRLGVQGSIDRDAVAKVVNSRLQEVRACYERALVKSPELAGKVVLEWSISTDGSVTSARSKSSTLRNLEVEQCIVRELKGWRFPPARGASVVITYPFLFNAVGF